jgi:DNA repair protein RAD16
MTLVVAPTVAIVQWRNEFSKFTTGFKVDVWHGASRATDLKKLQDFDVILTSCLSVTAVHSVLTQCRRGHGVGLPPSGEGLPEEQAAHEGGVDPAQDQVAPHHPGRGSVGCLFSD